MTGIFDVHTIGNVVFKNRLLRSSVGGRTCNYDGTLTDVWKNFERRFAEGGVGGIVSTTFAVDRDRVSPLQYPSLADDRNMRLLERFLPQIKLDGCRYIVQIGDPGYATQTSLFNEPQDALSSSDGWDVTFGYSNRRVAMDGRHIEQTIRDFGAAARRAKNAGADGVEITAAKGYLIHQFLSPAINRRDDRWGLGPDDRFRLLEEIVRQVRGAVGRDFLVGVRMAHDDFATLPWLFSLLRSPRAAGNDAAQMQEYARSVRELGVDYLHICGGYGFPNPFDIPGRFPTAEIRMHFNATRHLGTKAWWRALVFNLVPLWLLDRLLNIGWRVNPGINLAGAIGIHQHLADRPIPIIVNGGFERRDDVERALDAGMTMVSMARALIANRYLPNDLRDGQAPRARPCTYCSRCVGRTATSPLGCYDLSRFPAATPLQSQRMMQDQIMEWNRGDIA